MRSTSIWLCSAALVLVAVVAVCPAEELKFNLFPTVQTEAPGIEFDLFTMLDKCPCPNGECTCDPKSCICPNCPRHNEDNEKQPVVWAGKPNDLGNHAKVVSSDECAPCQTFKAGLESIANHVAIQNYSTLQGAAEAGYDELPRCELYHNGRLKLILVGGACKPKRVKEWLAETKNSVAGSSQQYRSGNTMFRCSDGSCQAVYSQPSYSQPTYAQPVYYSSRQSIYTGGCSTCRR